MHHGGSKLFAANVPTLRSSRLIYFSINGPLKIPRLKVINFYEIRITSREIKSQYVNYNSDPVTSLFASD